MSDIHFNMNTSQKHHIFRYIFCSNSLIVGIKELLLTEQDKVILFLNDVNPELSFVFRYLTSLLSDNQIDEHFSWQKSANLYFYESINLWIIFMIICLL